MASCDFLDSDGVHWRVWEVTPGEHLNTHAQQRNYLPDAMADGWLCFESHLGKRRLYPIPAGWSDQPDAELERLFNAAEPVSPTPVA